MDQPIHHVPQPHTADHSSGPSLPHAQRTAHSRARIPESAPSSKQFSSPGLARRTLGTNSERNLSALWGILAAHILTLSWEAALEDLMKLKDIIDTNTFTPVLVQLQQRTWLMHWALFVFFNHENGRNAIIDLFLSDRHGSLSSPGQTAAKPRCWIPDGTTLPAHVMALMHPAGAAHKLWVLGLLAEAVYVPHFACTE